MSIYYVTLLYCMIIPFSLFGEYKKRWTYPKSYFFFKKRTGFLFAPGVLDDDSSTIQLCRAYTTVAGVDLKSKTGIELIDADYCSSCIFPEIVIPVKPKKKKKQRVLSNGVLPRFFYRVGTWVRHRRTNKKYGKEPNSVVKEYDIDLTKLNIAQEPDLTALLNHYSDYVEETKPDNMVLYGFSRGAATTFTFMATKYAQHNHPIVKAVVLQGCFDSIRGTLNGWKRFDVNKFLSRMLPNYVADRLEPIHVVAEFPHAVPVLFITSKCDEVVPAKSTQKLAQALRQAGHPHVYILTVEHSPHSRYTSYHKEDISNIEKTVHAFYKKWGLSHIRPLARQGKKLLEMCHL